MSTTYNEKNPSLDLFGTLLFLSILIIDDDCDDAAFIKETIQEFSTNYRIVCLEKTSEVLQYLKSLTAALPSLVILDYNMPILKGIDVLKAIKSDEALKHIPVVVYSHSNYPAHKQECLDAGAICYLTKSSNLAGLKEDVRQMLSYCAVG